MTSQEHERAERRCKTFWSAVAVAVPLFSGIYHGFHQTLFDTGIGPNFFGGVIFGVFYLMMGCVFGLVLGAVIFDIFF